MCVFIFPKIVDQIAKRHIDAVPDGNKLGKPDLSFHCPVEDRGTQSARLGDKGNVSRFGHISGERGIQLQPGNNNSQAIRPDDPHAFILPDLDFDHLFKFFSLFTNFPETSRHDDDPPDSKIAAFPDNTRYFFSNGTYNRKVGDLWKRVHFRVTGDAHHRFVFGIYRVNHATETPAHQVDKHLSAHAVGIGRDSDQRNPLRVEDVVEFMDVHVKGQTGEQVNRKNSKPVSWFLQANLGLISGFEKA